MGLTLESGDGAQRNDCAENQTGGETATGPVVTGEEQERRDDQGEWAGRPPKAAVGTRRAPSQASGGTLTISSSVS